MSEELGPCPFCGSTNILVHYFDSGKESDIVCIHCCSSAVNRERWNTRAERTCKMENAGEVPQNVLEIETVWFCSECGSPIYNDMTPSYCIYCGARVVEVE